MIPKGWDFIPLEQLALVERGKFTARPRNDPRYYGGSIPFVQTGDVASANGFLKSYSQTLNEDGLSVSKLFPKGSILITIAANIGEVAVTSIDVACPDSIVVVQPKLNVCRDWLKYSLILKKRSLDALATRNAQKNINLQVLRPLQILTPPLEEQKRIAEILVTWDEAIALIEREIDAKKCLMKSLASNLLFGRKRFVPIEKYQFREHSCFSFPNDWKLIKLAEVFEERRETSSDLEKYDLASLTIEDGLIAKPERYNRDFLLKDKESNQYRIVYPGDFVYNPMNLRWGAIDCSKLSNPVLVSAYYNVLIPNKSIAPSNLLLSLLTTSQMIHVYNNVGIGSLIEKKRVHLSDFLKLEIPLPSLSEAIKIDSTLKTLIQEIADLTRYKDLLFKQKQGLMQKLLTGELRVAVQEAA